MKEGKIINEGVKQNEKRIRNENGKKGEKEKRRKKNPLGVYPISKEPRIML